MLQYIIVFLKHSSHCPGLAPRYVPVGGPGDTVLNREDYHGSTVVNRDDPWWTGSIRETLPDVLKCFTQPGDTGVTGRNSKTGAGPVQDLQYEIWNRFVAYLPKLF